MEDQKIIELFFDRSEMAIQALSAKYEKLLYKISFHILQDMRISENLVSVRLKRVRKQLKKYLEQEGYRV